MTALASLKKTPAGTVRAEAAMPYGPRAEKRTGVEVTRCAAGTFRGTGGVVRLRVSVDVVYDRSVQPRDAEFDLNETQAVELARALLGPGYRIELRHVPVDPARPG